MRKRFGKTAEAGQSTVGYLRQDDQARKTEAARRRQRILNTPIRKTVTNTQRPTSFGCRRKPAEPNFKPIQAVVPYEYILEAFPDKLIHRLSYSHLELFVDLDDDLKRMFYEIECIRSNWSVRELKRQLAGLYYERPGLSKDKKKPGFSAQEGTETINPSLSIRDPYVFEFLGL